jgi:hypothetical protein
MNKEIKDGAEHYFIQLCFCENRYLLRVKMRPLFDELLKKYTKEYAEGRRLHQDLENINKKFLGRLR